MHAFRQPRLRAQKQRESTTKLKVYCDSGDQKKLRTHSKRQNYALGFDSERLTRLCGQASHSGRSSLPIRLAMLGEKILPTARV